jgi:uncharacterized membrane protein
MTTYGDLWAAQNLEIMDARRTRTLRSLFTLPPVEPFPTPAAEPSEQQLALQQRNAPASRPEPDISTVKIDGSIGRLNALQFDLTASDRMLSFDLDRASDIAEALQTLKTSIEDRLKEADEFVAPEKPKLEPRNISIEDTRNVIQNALVSAQQSFITDALPPSQISLGDLNGGEGINLTITADNTVHTITAGADETLATFVDRFDALAGVSASFNAFGALEISGDGVGVLEIQENTSGSLGALGIIADDFNTPEGGGDPLGSSTAFATSIKETTIQKKTIFRVDGDARERIEERNNAIRKNIEDIEKDLLNSWVRAGGQIEAELERSFDRGSAMLSGQTMRLPSVNGGGGGRSITVGNLTPAGLGLESLDRWLSNQDYDKVLDAIDGALGRVERAKSNLSFGLSLIENETGLAQSRIGRLADQRDAITDAFTAEFVAQQTGLSLQAVQLATASNRSDQLRSF